MPSPVSGLMGIPTTSWSRSSVLLSSFQSRVGIDGDSNNAGRIGGALRHRRFQSRVGIDGDSYRSAAAHWIIRAYQHAIEFQSRVGIDGDSYRMTRVCRPIGACPSWSFSPVSGLMGIPTQSTLAPLSR